MTSELKELQQQIKELDEKNIKLLARDSQRKTMHEMLNEANIPATENGKSICLLRRVRIAVDRLIG